jgi:clan AA aspartic protease (TIGR02281 family)
MTCKAIVFCLGLSLLGALALLFSSSSVWAVEISSRPLDSASAIMVASPASVASPVAPNDANLQSHAAAVLMSLSQQSGSAYLASLARQLSANTTLAQDKANALRQDSETLTLQPTSQGGLMLPVGLGLQQGEVSFLLDTGASYTMISPELAKKLALNTQKPVKNMTIVTANGQVDVPMYRLKSLKLGHLTASNVDVLVQPLDKSLGFEGLLGMNALKTFSWTLLPSRLVLTPLHVPSAPVAKVSIYSLSP